MTLTVTAKKTSPVHLRAVRPDEAEVTDAVILDAWERGTANFGALFFDHLIGVIDGTLYRVLGERTAEHDDLAQNTFEQILLSLSEGKFKRECSLKSWASSIATRIALNAIRSRQTLRRYFASEDITVLRAAAHDDVEKSTEARQLLQQARHELAQISAKRAEALILHDVLGHDMAEVAAILRVTVAAAQSRVVRGRTDLHRRLAREGLVGQRENV